MVCCGCCCCCCCCCPLACNAPVVTLLLWALLLLALCILPLLLCRVASSATPPPLWAPRPLLGWLAALALGVLPRVSGRCCRCGYTTCCREPRLRAEPTCSEALPLRCCSFDGTDGGVAGRCGVPARWWAWLLPGRPVCLCRCCCRCCCC